MPASSTVVNAAESADLRLIHLLGSVTGKEDAASPFVLSCENHIANADAPNLLTTIFKDANAIGVLMRLSKDEAVGAFSLLSALLDRVDGDSENNELANEVLKLMVSAVESYCHDDESSNKEDGDLVEKKLNMLCMLYNLRSSSKEKVWILGRVIQLAVSLPSQTELLLGLLPGRSATLGDLLSGPSYLETAFDEKVTTEERRLLYGIIAKSIGKVKSMCVKREDLGKDVLVAEGLKQRYLLKFLGTYEDGGDLDKEGLEAAKEAAVGAIRDPVHLFHEQRRIMSMTPVAALEKNADTKPLHTLLQIFQEKKLQDFQSFISENKTILSEYNLSEEECIRQMRLLSLCSLASEHEEIPYDAIASTLQIKEEEVENWVIAAVSSGLLTAKMDQLQRVVMVERCVVRRFGMEQWKVLHNRLDVWKRNVRGVMDGLKQSQVMQ